ncbi:DUF2092 domain-containing protein [Azospirillum sp. RWY-5-1]|uniref:DUF2092 domain-containing protein n=1 Tax=Azospirillum oleiclasticum TaxID=2735135 RepID=A0ABX2T2H3_9PROT|nr:DUF2092 domain-containing protein [Azospirillum oleiclasticum]NYZ11154.1 DUF2092 domain-containing protein [Azospirillum oleiclasticum]NYZ18316.1 DUF2092 domain-containing protein [Azospirillum oleiclasticum]
MKRWMWSLCAVVCTAVITVSAANAAGSDRGTDAPAAIPADDGASATLMRMADTLARAKGLKLTIRADYDVLQESGEKISYREHRSIALVRPDRLRMEVQESNGARSTVSFDGTAITVYDPKENVYGRFDRPGTIDDAVRTLIQDLDVRLPLALLFVTTLPDELARRVIEVERVETDVLTAVPTDHLVGRTEGVDFQVWVPVEGPALPQRVTITYKTEDGQPQFRADLTDWIIDPDPSTAGLAFNPPADAERIPFLLRVRRDEAGAPSKTPGSAEGAGK